MTTVIQFEQQTKALIDELKTICANYGLGNDGNEFKIITQVFLYKFLNDKFAHEVKQIDSKLATSENWEKDIKAYSQGDYELLLMQLSESTARLKPEHFIAYLFENQNQPRFSDLFDETMLSIAK
jgi:type I restriction enzyme M protein